MNALFIELSEMNDLSLNSTMKLSEFEKLTNVLPQQRKIMPVLFSSHGSPMDIPLTKEQNPFWNSLNELGRELESKYDVKAAVVVSAHWLTRGTFVNVSPEQEQIFDFHGFPKEYYEIKYQVKGATDIAHEIKKLVPDVKETTDWGLDHGAWPMLMHLFPKGNIPVFQMSIDYYASPRYHYELGKQLKSLREKGVLIIGSGSLIHNLQLFGAKMRTGNSSPYGWEAEYDEWIKKQIDSRNFQSIIDYETSHRLGKLAAPTPDHFVPVLYSLGLMDVRDEVRHFYDEQTNLPAFSERSFILSNNF